MWKSVFIIADCNGSAPVSPEGHQTTVWCGHLGRHAYRLLQPVHAPTPPGSRYSSQNYQRKPWWGQNLSMEAIFSKSTKKMFSFFLKDKTNEDLPVYIHMYCIRQSGIFFLFQISQREISQYYHSVFNLKFTTLN